MLKVLIWIQRVVAVLVGCYGFLLIFSETPITESFLSQIGLMAGGFILLGLSVGWVYLTNIEEQLIRRS